MGGAKLIRRGKRSGDDTLVHEGLRLEQKATKQKEEAHHLKKEGALLQNQGDSDYPVATPAATDVPPTLPPTTGEPSIAPTHMPSEEQTREVPIHTSASSHSSASV